MSQIVFHRPEQKYRDVSRLVLSISKYKSSIYMNEKRFAESAELDLKIEGRFFFIGVLSRKTFPST